MVHLSFNDRASFFKNQVPDGSGSRSGAVEYYNCAICRSLCFRNFRNRIGRTFYQVVLHHLLYGRFLYVLTDLRSMYSQMTPINPLL